MKTFIILGKKFEFDETKTYMDFYVTDKYTENCKGHLQIYNFSKYLESLQNNGVTEEDFELIRYFERWLHEAPRKRFYRKMQLDGMHVLSDEFFFENDPNGEKYLDNLENSGKLAYELLELFNQQHTKPIPDSQNI